MSSNISPPRRVLIYPTFIRWPLFRDLTTQIITQSDGTPTCSYDVLQESMNGPIAKYANIGDVLVHKFTCDSADMGILVHSCRVRDSTGNEFALLNERGCATDTTIVTPLRYSDDLRTAFTPIAAFKFADQMIVYFTCQITLCSKRDNGCEGITPPQCQYVPLPNEDGGDDISVVDTTPILQTSDYLQTSTIPTFIAVTLTPPFIPPTFIPVTPTSTITPPPITSTSSSRTPTSTTPTSESNYNGSHMPSSIPPGDYTENANAGYGGGRYAPGKNNNSPYENSNIFNRIGSTPTTIPTSPQLQPFIPPQQALRQSAFVNGIPAARHARKINDTNLITLGVTAEQLIIFTKDEKSDAKEMSSSNSNMENIIDSNHLSQQRSQICQQQKEQQQINPIWAAICAGMINFPKYRNFSVKLL
uniref:ZP domain-containing protein n=1 Tax=Panagrolaimus superbus TaxID=310955 RepID=A0A914Y7Q9_9BILA